MNWVHIGNLVEAHLLAAEALTSEKGYVAVSTQYNHCVLVALALRFNFWCFEIKSSPKGHLLNSQKLCLAPETHGQCKCKYILLIFWCIFLFWKYIISCLIGENSIFNQVNTFTIIQICMLLFFLKIDSDSRCVTQNLEQPFWAIPV